MDIPAAKYAVFVYADQTIVYVGAPDTECSVSPFDGTTVSHRTARIWTDAAEARREADSWGCDSKGPCARVELVHDEAEFRAREDTW